MKRFLVLLILLTSVFPVITRADIIEGPEGCTWNATVKKTDKSSMSVHVDEQYGSCVDEPCPFDAEGKTYRLPVKKYKSGQVIKIWVDLDKKAKDRATTNVPKCWTQTVGSTANSQKSPDPAAAIIPDTNTEDMPPITQAPTPDAVKSDDLSPIGKPQ